jgi:hypothetical protein
MDLIGYMLVGPARLPTDDETKGRAAAVAQAALDALRATKEALEFHEFDFPEQGDECPVPWPGALPVPGGREPGMEFEDAWAEVAGLGGRLASAGVETGSALVDALIDVWHHGARDAASRELGNAQVMFAGEPSWGDEPGGYGYSVFKAATLFGIAQFFGIQ